MSATTATTTTTTTSTATTTTTDSILFSGHLRGLIDWCLPSNGLSM